jgi:hypothetical protein
MERMLGKAESFTFYELRKVGFSSPKPMDTQKFLKIDGNYRDSLQEQGLHTKTRKRLKESNEAYNESSFEGDMRVSARVSLEVTSIAPDLRETKKKLVMFSASNWLEKVVERRGSTMGKKGRKPIEQQV